VIYSILFCDKVNNFIKVENGVNHIYTFREVLKEYANALEKQKPRFYTGFLLLIGGNAWKSNPAAGLTRHISFEGCGAHQGHIRFQNSYYLLSAC